MLELLALWACSAPEEDPTAVADPEVVRTDSLDVPDDAVREDDQDRGHTTASARQAPSETVDVLVIGAGPAGLAAAHTVVASARSVRVLEKESDAGGSGWYAGRYFGVNTRWQRARGISDSVDAALADWPDLAGGATPDEHVRQLIERSSEVIDFLTVNLGCDIQGLGNDPGVMSTPRLHTIEVGNQGPVEALLDRIGDRVSVETKATGLVFEDGRVAGSRWEDTVSGETGWIRANAVIVASGGFARNMDEIVRDRPEFATVPYLVEIGFPADGGGIPLLEAAGAQWQNRGRMGFYAHSIADPDRAGEALWPTGLQYGIFLDIHGNRIVNEEEMAGFELVDTLLAAPSQRILAVLGGDSLGKLTIPSYNVDEGDPTFVPLADLIDRGVIGRYPDTDALAADWGMDPAVVQATFDRYEALVLDGEDADFHKDRDYLRSFGNRELYVLDLLPGAAKAFSGFAVDIDGRITDAGGRPVPGLYAAGEAIGMLGSEGAGSGFAGSITSVYLTGIVAAETAVSDRD